MSNWITVEVDRALYVDRGRNVILCEGPMPGPHTLVLKLKEAEMTKTPVEAAQGHLQSRGRHYDIIREAISAYDEYMLDDGYDAQGTLDKIIKKMRERVDMAAAPVEESEPKSAFACPICGSDKPHHHYQSEVEIERYCRPEFEKWAEGRLTSCHRRARGKIAISNFIEWKVRDSGGYREDDLQVSWNAFKEAWLTSNALVRRPTVAPATADQPDICPTCGINRNSPFPCEHPRLSVGNVDLPTRLATDIANAFKYKAKQLGAEVSVENLRDVHSYVQVTISDALTSTGPQQSAAPVEPCPYAIGGCVLEKQEIGPCLCANPVQRSSAASDGLRTFDTTGTVFRRMGNVLTITCESSEIANRVADQLRTPVEPQGARK